MVLMNKLNIGEYYNIRYKSPWNSDNPEVVTAKVVAITSEEQGKYYSVDSIFSEYFARHGMSISTYVTTLQVEPVIYVVVLVKDDPIQGIVEDEEPIIIPKFTIDFNLTDKLIECDKTIVRIEDVVSHSELVFDRGEFFENLEKDVKKSLRNIKEFGDYPINVYFETSKTLREVTAYNEYVKSKTTSYESAKLANDISESDFRRRVSNLADKEALLFSKEAQINAKESSLDADKSKLTAILDTIKGDIVNLKSAALLINDSNVNVRSDILTIVDKYMEAFDLN